MRLRAIAVCLALGLAGCGSSIQPGSLDTEPRTWKAKDLDSVRKRWTVSGRVRKDFDLALHASAVYLAWDLRAAIVAKVTEVRAFTIAETEAERTRHLEEVVKYNDFIVTTQAHEHAWANLADQREKAFTIGLLTEDGRVARPLSVKRLRPTSELKMLYPQVAEGFALTFLVRFPAAPEGRVLLDERTRAFRLRFAGAPGRLDLVFKVAAPPGTAD